MQATITAEHGWLARLAGNWRFEMPGPDGGVMQGTVTARMLGQAWLLLETRSEADAGTSMDSVMTLGYDPAQRAFVGSWIGSMMNHLWVYRGGSLDAAQRLLALPSEGPSFDDPGKTVAYRDEIELISDDEHHLHGNVQGADGQWTRFMTARYTRIK